MIRPLWNIGLGGLVLFIGLLAGCGENQNATRPPAQLPVKADPATAPVANIEQGPPAANSAPASISGRVTFVGTPPKRKALLVQGDKTCEEMYKDAPLLSEELIVDAQNQGIQNAFIYIKSGFGERTFDPPKEPVVFAAEKCRLSPHVAGALLNQDFQVSMGNAECMRSVQSIAAACAPASEGLIQPFSYHEVKMGVPIRCRLHGWMLAYVCYVDNPFFTVTGPDGSFSLHGVSPGAYELALWHEKLGEQVQTIIVTELTPVTADFRLSIEVLDP